MRLNRAMRMCAAYGVNSDKSRCIWSIYIIETGVLPGVEIVGIDDEADQEIVLGRNVLNQLILLLDGPHLQTDVLERRPNK